MNAYHLLIVLLVELLATRPAIIDDLQPSILWAEQNQLKSLAISLTLLTISSIFAIPGHGILLICTGVVLKSYLYAHLINVASEIVAIVISTILAKILLSNSDGAITNNPRMKVAQEAVESNGFFTTILMRGSLAIPIGTYLFSPLMVSNFAYIIGTIISMVIHIVPPTMVGVFIGITAEAENYASVDIRPTYMTLLVITICEAFLMGATFIVVRKAYRTLRARYINKAQKLEDQFVSITSYSFTKLEKMIFIALLFVCIVAIAACATLIHLNLGPVTSVSSAKETVPHPIYNLPTSISPSTIASSTTAFISPTNFTDDEMHDI